MRGLLQTNCPMGETRMLGRVNHIAIAVPDLAAATATYRDTLGATVSAPQALPEHGVTVVFVELPNTKDTVERTALCLRGKHRELTKLMLEDLNPVLYERIRVLGDAVQFVGGVDVAALPGLYQGSRAFVMPSLYEGFGLGALEAMACGAPVLAADAGALPEVVSDAGLLLPPTDPAAWADALERVLLDPALTAALRARGPAQAARFSWARAARETLAVYRVASSE